MTGPLSREELTTLLEEWLPNAEAWVEDNASDTPPEWLALRDHLIELLDAVQITYLATDDGFIIVTEDGDEITITTEELGDPGAGTEGL